MPDPELTITVHAGPHPRQDCPVLLTLPETLPEGSWELAADTGETRPLQRLDGKDYAYMEKVLPAGERRTYHLQPHYDLDDAQADGLHPRDVYEAIAQELGVPFVDLKLFKPDENAFDTVPVDVCLRHNVLPVKKDGNALWVAMSQVDDLQAADDLRLASRCTIYGVVADPDQIRTAIRRLYKLESEEGSAVHVTQENDSDLAIYVNNTLLTRYICAGVPARPFFYPLLSSQGIGLTRGYPMQANVSGETQDHPHHRSLWIAYGDVNGVDNWSEEPGHGYTVHQSIDRLDSGDVAGRFSTTSLWMDANRKPLLTQRLYVTAWATSEEIRLLDFSILLTATHGDVLFGDTKEGGILSARVASALDVPRGGRIENVYGGIDEAETWGKSAHWCDYSGAIGGQPVGIAILDHPLSFRYPTHWHVRNYGLMTANPFAYAAYTNGVKDGSHTLSAGASLCFRYRVLIHSGDTRVGRVQDHYLNFVSPPKVTISPD